MAPRSVHASGRRYEWANENPIMGLPESWLEQLARPHRDRDQVLVEAAHLLDLDQETAYGSRALERELERLLRAQAGERNEVLNRSAYRLAQLAAGNQLPLARVERETFEAALLTGLEPSEIAKTIRSATSAGLRSPRSPSRARVRATVKEGYRGHDLHEGHDLQRPSTVTKVLGPTMAGSYPGNPDNHSAREREKSPLELFAEIERERERENGRPAGPTGLARHRCGRWVHRKNGYQRSRCGPLRIETRTCKVCGGETSSATRNFCAGCHFAGWWGRCA